jgi:hypothetical protein
MITGMSSVANPSLNQQAVRNPDSADIAENPSYYWLGNMAEEGNGVEGDLEIAAEWYRLGAGWATPSVPRHWIGPVVGRIGKRAFPKTGACI